MTTCDPPNAWFSEFNHQTDETARQSALRFCVPNLPSIESALGTIGDMDGSDLHQGVNEDEREALLGTCAMIVEDAINAVLLGLRERVRVKSLGDDSKNVPFKRSSVVWAWNGFMTV